MITEAVILALVALASAIVKIYSDGKKTKRGIAEESSSRKLAVSDVKTRLEKLEEKNDIFGATINRQVGLLSDGNISIRQLQSIRDKSHPKSEKFSREADKWVSESSREISRSTEIWLDD